MNEKQNSLIRSKGNSELLSLRNLLTCSWLILVCCKNIHSRLTGRMGPTLEISFLGLLRYHPRFVSNYSNLISLLIDLTRMGGANAQISASRVPCFIPWTLYLFCIQSQWHGRQWTWNCPVSGAGGWGLPGELRHWGSNDSSMVCYHICPQQLHYMGISCFKLDEPWPGLSGGCTYRVGAWFSPE